MEQVVIWAQVLVWVFFAQMLREQRGAGVCLRAPAMCVVSPWKIPADTLSPMPTAHQVSGTESIRCAHIQSHRFALCPFISRFSPPVRSSTGSPAQYYGRSAGVLSPRRPAGPSPSPPAAPAEASGAAPAETPGAAPAEVPPEPPPGPGLPAPLASRARHRASGQACVFGCPGTVPLWISHIFLCFTQQPLWLVI